MSLSITGKDLLCSEVNARATDRFHRRMAKRPPAAGACTAADRRRWRSRSYSDCWTMTASPVAGCGRGDGRRGRHRRRHVARLVGRDAGRLLVSTLAALFMKSQACAPETARPSEAARNSNLVILVILRFMRRDEGSRRTAQPRNHALRECSCAQLTAVTVWPAFLRSSISPSGPGRCSAPTAMKALPASMIGSAFLIIVLLRSTIIACSKAA